VVSLHMISVNGIELNVAISGEGPAVVLMHGFPHTWQVWQPIIPALAMHHTVIAPDLRGFGSSSRPESGYTASTVASDIVAMLDALNIDQADVVAMDLGTPAAFLVGLTYPQRVRRLVLMESLIGSLPGAEEFLKAGPPWWFGFHSVPGFAETVLAANAATYIDFFLKIGTRGDGVTPEFATAAHEAFSTSDRLRAAFEHYRAFPESGQQIASAVSNARLTVPTLTVGSSPVGDTTFKQLEPIADHITGLVLENAGHIIPQHRPEELLEALEGFLQ
jgi:pimeloyl-ACP methyl ester carboxylesterase